MHLPGRTLRGRLALLTALAVTLAVGAACVSAYLLARSNLLHAVDASLQSAAPPIGALPPSGAPPPTVTPPGLQFEAQQLAPDGSVVTSFGAARLPVTEADRQIARGGGERLVDTTDSAGTHVRMLVRALPTGGAIMVARPLTETNRTLSQLGLLLVVVAAGGVLGAAGLGFLVARAGIRPVDRLTAAAERIARTQRPDPPLPVQGGDELARLGRAFNAMVTALAASRDRQRQLVLDAGHELRTPVTVLRTNAELLRRAEQQPGNLPSDQRRHLLADMQTQAEELGALVGELIELAREDEEGIQHVPVDLREPLLRAVDRVRLRAPATTSFDVDAAPSTVTGDAGVLERAFVNVLDNAVKFGPPEQTVRVRLRDRRVCIADEGPGIAADDVPHVFDRFYRAPASRQLPGSGLGLAIVAQAAELHGATVRAESRPAGGTNLLMDFPSPDSRSNGGD